jgi:hypothetical protein
VERLAGLFVIAAPYWGADESWQWDEGTLPADAASKLAGAWTMFFYQSRDDESCRSSTLGCMRPGFRVRRSAHSMGADINSETISPRRRRISNSTHRLRPRRGE